MNLVVITAFIAVCGAAKLDRTYLPPSSAETAGGSPGSLQAPFTRSSVQGLETLGLPTGSYTNNFGGVVVDAAAPGTRTPADADLSGLGGPRPSYGSTDSKVGDAAFRGSVAGVHNTPSFGATGQTNGQFNNHAEQSSSNGHVENGIGSAGHFTPNGQVTGQNFQSFTKNKSERPQAASDRNSNIISLSNDVNSDSYSYGFETDNGIAVGENGVAVNGVQAAGGYSYQGDDGQVYKVTYTADEGGYRPQGDHLPTPPPIPEEILKSLEQNAKEEAAGLVDDGSYDAHKYNDGDYMHDNSGNIQYNGEQSSQFGKRPESDATASGSFINQNGQVYTKPGSGQFGTGSDPQKFNGQSSHGGLGQFEVSGAPHSTFNGPVSQENRKPGSGQFGITGSQSTFNGQSNEGNQKPGSGQFGITGSQSTFNGQSSQGHVKPGSGQFEITGLQSTFNGQSNEGNQKPVSGQFGITGSQSTFNGQSSQAHGKPGSGQSSHSSQLLSRHQESSGQTFTQNTINQGNQLSASLASGQGAFENQAQFGSQSSQHALASAQFENQSPSSEFEQSQQSSSSQFGSRPMKPAFGQSTGSSTFNSQSAHPQFGSSFKPQGSEAFSGASLNQDQDVQDFGKPFPQTFSGLNFNRPSAGNSNSNKPSRGQVQASKFESSVANSFNRFPQASSHKNDYLPPVISNVQPQSDKTAAFASGFDTNLSNSGSSTPGFNLNSQKPGKNENIPNDFVAPNEQKPSFASASATASFSQSAFESQPAKPFNAFNTQSQSKPNHFQKPTTQFSQPTSQFSSQNPAQISSNSQQSASFAQTESVFSSKPTSIPEAELTTPLKPNETPASVQSSQFSSQTMSSFGSFDSKPASDKEQTQGNSAFGQNLSSQTLSPSFSMASQSANAKSGTTSTQSAFQFSKRPENSNDRPQFSQSSFGQNQQNQHLLNQGVDNSYYYNQPSKPFSVSGVHPQGSRFPSSPSYQSNGIASQNQNLNKQSPFQSSSKYSGSLAPAIPTSASQFTQTQGYNGITQAAISPFPSASLTPSIQLGSSQFASKPTFNQQTTFNSQFQSSGNQKGTPTFSQVSGQPAIPSRPALQFGMKPTTSGSQSLNQFVQSENTPDSSDGSSQQQSTMTQQYQGTVYEYNKPAEVLPASTQTDSSLGQPIQSEVTSETTSSFVSQKVQLSSQQNSKPFSQFGESVSKLGAQNKPFGSASSSTQFAQLSQTGHGSQIPKQTGIQIGSQPAKPFNAPSSTGIQFSQTGQPGLFGVPSTSAQLSQTAQLVPDSSSSMATQQNAQGTQQPFRPFNSPNHGIQFSIDSQPQSGSKTTQFSQNTQTFGSSQNSQPARVSSQSQFTSQTFGNAASGQDRGYFYPGNPNPQFQIAENSKNQFNQNSQSGSPEVGTNQFKQHSQNADQNQNSQPKMSSQNELPSFSGSFNQQTSQNQINFAPKHQFGAQSTQFSQNTQAQFGKAPNSPIIGQPFASSQAIASGQASASASASSSPRQQYKPFESQNMNQFGQIQKLESQDQNGQGTQQFGVQNLKPFGSYTAKPTIDASKPYGALNSKPFVAQGSAEVSKPLFSSCCQGSKDSTPAQSTDRPSQASFQGTQNFNAQDLAGKGEEFGGPRQPPRFDVQTGYHY